jgi:hypothetical protein
LAAVPTGAIEDHHGMGKACPKEQSAYDARARLKLANPFRKIDRAAKVFG